MAHAEFLSRSGVRAELHSALRQLSVEQPADPISFLAKHFDNLVKPAREHTLVCAEHLRETDALDSTQLDSAVYKAFIMLSDSDSVGDALSGRVQGVVVNKLLREMCCDLDPGIADTLLCKVQTPPEAVLSYSSFKQAVLPRLNLQAFVKMAREVFESIDVKQTGSIRRQVGEDVLSRLSGNLAQSAAGSDSESAKLAKQSISPTEISAILQRDPLREGVTSLDEFERTAGQMFVNHLPVIRST